MSHLSSIFTKIPVDIPNRSGFDLSFENLLTLTTGTLTPVLLEEVIPNETYNLGHLSQVSMPPLATNFFGRVDMRYEAFFVPSRIIWGGWQTFWTMPENNPFALSVIRPSRTPGFIINQYNLDQFGPGTLSDYLGYKFDPPASDLSMSVRMNLLPFLVYHRIYHDWYRNQLIQLPVFSNIQLNSGDIKYDDSVVSAPWLQGDFLITPSANSTFDILGDGVSVFSLRQRNWAKDNFTTAALYPQASGDVTGAVVESSDGDISIPAIRQANVLQRWLERNNICGFEYSDQIKGQYGVLPSDAIMNRAIFLGSDSFGIYNRSVSTTSNSTQGSDPKNPFLGVAGGTAGSANGYKDGNLIDNFQTTEHGYIMVLASIVPHANYSTGIRRQLLHQRVGDYAIPLLQGLGEQAIYNKELSGNVDALGSDAIFGYQQQYYEYKYHDDEVHGLLRDGQSLESFALQRSFSTPPSLSTNFLQIPKNFMDQVFNTSVDLSKFNAWLDVYFNFRKVSPLSEYVIPTLGDLKNTHKESIDYRGRML